MDLDFDSIAFFSWNSGPSGRRGRRRPVTLYDETLRDGLQSASVSIPPIHGRTAILDAMEEVGIETACLGFPAVSEQTAALCLACAGHVGRNRLRLRPTLVARTLIRDIEPILSICDASGIPHEVLLFLGVGYARQYCESWDMDTMNRLVESAVTFSVAHGLNTTFVIEDASRTHPDMLETFFKAALNAGADRLVLTDTVGAADPSGIKAMVGFVRGILDAGGYTDIGLDFHGHMDRGLGVVNSLAAIEAGADRIHACGLGIGERCGNTPMEQMLLNLYLSGYESSYDISRVADYCRIIADHLRVPIPHDKPVVGRDAFRNNAGIHATAILKAMKQGTLDLANRIYYCVPPETVGRKLDIAIGPMSGKANAEFWLRKNRIPVTRDRIAAILDLAKDATRILSDREIFGVIHHV